MKIRLFILFSFICFQAFSQEGTIQGRVYNLMTNEPIAYATVAVQNQNAAVLTDIDGKYKIILPVGIYNINCSYIGYISKTIAEVEVKISKPATIDFPLEKTAKQLTNVIIESNKFSFDKSNESPVSLRTIGVNEIQRNPGGNRDISKVIQSLPGVSTVASFRNDIIIRGGAPNENRFFLDGVEVPNINHFATQGSSGGPVGLINVDFIKEVKFYSGAFPSNRGNSLSSVFEFTQIDGRTDRVGLTGTLGSSDFALTMQGPLTKNKNNTFIFSVRRSYLQLLFKALQLPFLPTYNDYQFKTKFKFNKKNELSIISLGALDRFALNLNANETDFQKYLLGNLPVNNQWNYTFGIVYKNYGKNNFLTIVASRNMLNNDAFKYLNNDDSKESNKIFDYNSQEIENKLRIENNYYKNGWKVNYGAGYEYVKYNNKTFQTLSTPNGLLPINFSSDINFNKFNAFTQITKGFYNQILVASIGARTDFNSYSSAMSNPLKQISPRASLTYNVTEKFNINFNTGIYYQLPAYTVLGYRNSLGELENKDNSEYITCKHVVAGFEYYTKSNTRFSIEGFYKLYSQYPFLIADSVSLANLGADFGVIGNAPVTSISNGKSYGLEFLIQQKLYKGFYGIAALTLFRSLFEDKDGNLISSSWDQQYTLALTAGKKFKKLWEIGAKWRLSGGAPYTPIDIQRSSLINVWDITGQGQFDYRLLNSNRLPIFHQLDLRIDKRYLFKKFSLEIYLDVQNAYAFKTTSAPYLDVRRDENGIKIIDDNLPNSYQTYLIDNIGGNVIPAIGIIFEY